MSGTKQENYNTVGTILSLKIPKDNEKPIKLNDAYFFIKIHAAQAVFAGSIWEQARQLVVTSQVQLNHPLFKNAARFIHRTSRIRRKEATQLGIARNLVELIPATMDQISISIEFLVDKKNRLGALAALINTDAFVSAISFAPGAVAVTKTVGKLAQKVLNTFLDVETQQPILQFVGDFNITADELSNAYYVILGAWDKKYPLPRPLPHLDIQGRDLLVSGQPVTRWSYVILDVTAVEARTAESSPEESWYKKLIKARTQGTKAANNPFSTDAQRRKTWEECQKLLEEAHLLLLEDPTYLQREVKQIIQEAYAEAWNNIYPKDLKKLGAPPMLNTQARTLLGVDSEEALEAAVQSYKDSVEHSRPLLKELGVLQ